MPLIIMGQFLNFNSDFGPWGRDNYAVYQFLAYNIFLLQGIVTKFPAQLNQEKFWQTLPALIIGPFNRINLLFGIFFSHLILISIPFSIFFILALIILPISFMTIISILFFYLLLALTYSGIGLIIGIFAISKENMWQILTFIFSLIIWFSCVTYPFEIFPGILQDIINLNPFYHIFDFLRIVWFENNILTSIMNHINQFMILILCAISFPLIGVYIFNIIYRKYGIIGY